MKGAEIALVEGLRLKVGSGEACDIVIADGALPEVAFELDVSAEAVSLIEGDRTRTLAPFEIAAAGATEIAVGPADAPWKPLVRPRPPEPEPDPAPASEPESGEASVSEPPPAPDGEPPRRRRGCGLGCLLALLLFVAAGAALWWFWPRVVEACPWAETVRATVAEKAVAGWTRVKGMCGASKPAAPASKPTPSLAEVVRGAGLELADRDGVPLVRGNLRRRTERQAILALARAADPRVRFDLTDDESLLAAADALLFVVTEGAVKATQASNRVVTVVGYAPSAAALERTVRALNADVKGLGGIVTKGVRVGGPPPPKAERLVFADPKPAEGEKDSAARADAARDLPIAGILTVPYPCVVMQNGLRLAEGAQIGTAVIERIESGRLLLRAGAATFEWRP